MVEAIKNVIIIKSEDGMEKFMGRKAFQLPFIESVKLLHSMQDVYLCTKIDLA